MINNNFYDQFRQHSTDDLLRIVLRPDQYQPEAVTAADRLLREREVSHGEREQAERSLQDEETMGDRMDQYKERIAQAIQPMIAPSPTDPAQWFRYFLLAFALYYIYNVYLFIKDQVAFWRCTDCKEVGALFYESIYLAYLSVTLFLLIKKGRWGWILLFVGVFTFLILLLDIIRFRFNFRGFIRFNPAASVLEVAIPVALLVFLWRAQIADLFDIDKKTKLRTAIASVAVAGACFALLHLRDYA